MVADRKVNDFVRDERGNWQRDKKTFGEEITDGTAAKDETERLRTLIRSGALQRQEQEKKAALTLRQLADEYFERFVTVDRAATANEYRYSLNTICKTVLPRPRGGSAPLGEWLVDSIVTGTIRRFREVTFSGKKRY